MFVTLHVAKKLRGCIGVIEGSTNLGETLARCAADAALHDPRFSRMRPEEMDALEIEVSLLSPLQPIRPKKWKSEFTGCWWSAGCGVDCCCRRWPSNTG